MAANEIIANAALLETGHQLGEYDIVEPHDDLNMSQSTNDSYPTALKVAMVTNNDLVVAIAVLESQRLLANTMETFRTRCVDGITVNADTLAGYIERTVGIVTALNPVIGYEKATELAK